MLASALQRGQHPWRTTASSDAEREIGRREVVGGGLTGDYIVLGTFDGDLKCARRARRAAASGAGG